MFRVVRWVFATLIVLGLNACSDERPATPQGGVSTVDNPERAAAVQLPRVLDSFNVGENVYVRSLAVEGDDHTLWVGTSVGVLEVDIATQALRNTFTRQHGLANEYVFAIFVDSQGYKWFGTNSGGVSRYKDGDWKVFFPMHGLADYWVYAFAERDESLWIGTWAGANKVDLKSLKFKTYLKELINEWVYGIDIDSKGRVWFGTEGGISMFDGEQWKHWTHDDGLGAPNVTKRPFSTNTGLGTRSRHDLNVLVEREESYNPNYVFSVKVDRQDSVWAGTWGGGVSRYDGNGWKNYTTADGLAGNIVYSIEIAPDGAYWFGTNHGVTRYDGKTWNNYDRADGLLDDNVYALTITADGQVWAGTKRGVTRLGTQGDRNETKR